MTSFGGFTPIKWHQFYEEAYNMPVEEFLKWRRPYFYPEGRPWFNEPVNQQGIRLTQDVRGRFYFEEKDVIIMQDVMNTVDELYLVSYNIMHNIITSLVINVYFVDGKQGA